MIEGILFSRLETILSFVIAWCILVLVVWLTHHSWKLWRCSEIYHLLINCSIGSNRTRKLRRWLHLTLLQHINVPIICSRLALNNIWILTDIDFHSIHMSRKGKLRKSFRIHGLRIIVLVGCSVLRHMSHNFSLGKFLGISFLINSKIRQLIVYLHFCFILYFFLIFILQISNFKF